MEENGVDVVEAVKKWLAENGYDYAVRAYLPGEAGKGVKKEKDTISVPAKVESVETFMEQFAKTFDDINMLTESKSKC